MESNGECDETWGHDGEERDKRIKVGNHQRKGKEEQVEEKDKMINEE